MIYAYVGTFTRTGRSQGIEAYTFDPKTGGLSHFQTAEVADPSYLAISPSRRTLYAASRGDEVAGQSGSSVVAYSLDAASGRLTRLNHVLIPSQPAYIKLDRTERFALFACTFGGAVGVVPIQPDGSVAEPSEIVQHEGASLTDQGFKLGAGGRAGRYPAGSPFPHSIHVAPDNRFVLVPELGLNRVVVYRLDAERGTLTPNDPPWAEGSPLGDHRMTPDHAHWESPRGAGPRHLEFHPNGRWVYVVNELGSIVNVFEYDADRGALRNIQDITTLPDSFREFSITADIHVHPNGRYLYASNRGHDSIAMYAIDQASGKLDPIGFEPTGGQHPRNFVITPDARLLLVGNLNSNNVVVFEIDEASGRLKPNGTVNDVPSPSCITFFSE